MLTLAIAAPAPPVVAQELLGDEEANDLIEEIKRAASDAEKALQEKSSDRLYLSAVVDAADYEPDRLLEWVASETRWTPYSGRLRGSDGVLMDRRGNSLDRALLLSSLLEEAGYETRLARAQLPSQATKDLSERETARTKTADSTGGVADHALKVRNGLTVADVKSQVSQIADELARRISWDGPIKEKEHQAAAARDHWWVQAELTNAHWENLDPLYTISAASQPEPQSFVEPDALAPELDHALRVQVVIERFQEGRIEEEIPLELHLRASEIAFGVPIELLFLPHSDAWAEDVEGNTTIADTTEYWLPVAQYNGTPTTGKWISESGLLVDSPASYSGKEKIDTAAQALSGMGGATTEEIADSHLTAVWIDYQIRAPDRQIRSVRREITDVLGAHRRLSNVAEFKPSAEQIRDRGLALQSYTVILPLTSMPAPEAINRAILELWAENRNPFIAMVYQAAGWEDERVPQALDQIKHKPIDLLTIAALRQAWSGNVDRIFLDQINVLATHFFVRDSSSGTDRTMGIDVVANGVGVIASAAGDPRRVRLEQGVLDTLAEAVLFESGAAINTFHLSLAEAGKLTEWPSVTSADQALAIESLGSSNRALIAKVVGEGSHVVVHPKPMRFGKVPFASWWQIDPADGTTLGRGYRGWGAVITEKTLRNITVDTAAKKAVQKTGATASCKMAIVATSVAERVVIAKLHSQGVAKLPVRKFQKACYILK